jgi:hypothetical protein
MASTLLARAERRVWEDDLELDSVIRDAGYTAKCIWIDNPRQYRQALPVFDQNDIRAVFERTLHYSMHIPGEFADKRNLLHLPLDWWGNMRKSISPRFKEAITVGDSLIEEITESLNKRLNTIGFSWVDWGDYRHVVRVGDPFVQVWKCESDMV